MKPPNSLKGCPIIAVPNSPTQKLSSLLQKILTPLVPKLKSYTKDDWDFLKKDNTEKFRPKLYIFNVRYR